MSDEKPEKFDMNTPLDAARRWEERRQKERAAALEARSEEIKATIEKLYKKLDEPQGGL